MQRKRFVYLFEVLQHERVIIVQNRDPETVKVFFCVLVVIKNLLKMFYRVDECRSPTHIQHLDPILWKEKAKHLNQFINIKFNFSLVFVQIAPVYEHLRF